MPTILLASWPVEASLYDGEDAAGPVCSLFADDPSATLEAIKANPESVHRDIQRIAKSFFMPEHIDPADAIPLIRKPR